MSCKETDRLIERLLDGPMVDPEMEALEAHAQVCPACRREIDSFEKMQRLLTEGLGATTSEVEARDRVLPVLDNRPLAPKGVSFRWPVHLGLPTPAAAGLLLVLGVSIGLGLGRSRPGAPHVQSIVAGSRQTPGAPETVTPIRVCSVTGTVVIKHPGAKTWEEVALQALRGQYDVPQHARVARRPVERLSAPHLCITAGQHDARSHARVCLF